jgi:hypothetical protein
VKAGKKQIEASAETERDAKKHKSIWN